jgi:pyrimidine-nucleoside phosphorylase
LAAELVRNGAAFTKFCESARLQGGDPKALQDTSLLPRAQNQVAISTPTDGYVSKMDCEKIGIASLVLGGGREKKEDSIDPAVGIVLHKKTGDHVSAGEPLCTLHYNGNTRLDEARVLIREGYEFDAAPPRAKRQLVLRIIEGRSVQHKVAVP